MSTSTTDMLYSGTQKTAPSVSLTATNLCFGIYPIIIPCYGALNPNSFMENKTASKFTHDLNDSVILYSNSATNISIYISIQKNEDIKKANENVEYEDDIEDLLDWDIWIESPPVSKTITVNAQFIKGNFILPSIDEDLEG